MDRDILLVLIGAGFTIAGGVVTSLLQAWLAVWTHKRKLEIEREKKQQDELRKILLPPESGGGLEPPPTLLESWIVSIGTIIEWTLLPKQKLALPIIASIIFFGIYWMLVLR